MSSVVQEFVDILGEFKGLKSGISGSRIKKLTEIAVQNVSSHSELIDKCMVNLKSSTETHKLGALYIIDSIARAYQDVVNKNESNSADASAALSNLNGKIKEALSITLNACPSDHKEKVGKLIAIWKKYGTFDRDILDSVHDEYFGDGKGSTTPKTAPPALVNTTNASDLLKNLASLQNQTSTGATLSAATAPSSSGSAQASSSSLPPLPNIPGLPSDPRDAIAQLVSNMQNSGDLAAFMQQQLQQQQEPQYQQQQESQYQQQRQPSQQEAFQQSGLGRGDHGGRDDGYDRDRRGGNGYSRRPRSRSPQRNQKPLPPPGHVIGEKNVPGTAHYREKNVQMDPNLPYNSIKVLSRTLFVGGIPTYMTSEELKSVLRPYAEVQSVIMNSERKHAFVKAYSRKEAESVIDNYQQITAANLRVRWGVGYGPRDCCDYIHGVSIVPIDRLTDADKRWVNSAEWGGIGLERPLVPNLVMEEPDIEIGEGVSSKAISKKMPTDASRNGPRSNRPGEPDETYATNNAGLPSFMQNNNRENPLANLFGNSGAGFPPMPTQAASQPPTGAPAGTSAPSGDANAQLANLMAMLQKQQGN
jgi:protein NRD1